MARTAVTHLAPRTYSPNQRGVPAAEAPLQEAAAGAAALLAPTGCQGLFVIPELELLGARPDLWIGSFDEGIFRRRVDAGLEACTAPYPLAVAQTLRRLGGEASLEELCSSAHRLGERRRIQRGVSELVDRGLAFRDDNAVILSAVFSPANARGVGVEAKTGRWRKAVRQVQMSASLLNGAWLVFPSSYLPHVPRQEAAMRGVGIAVVEDGVAHVVRRPRFRVGRPGPRMLLEEHLYARWRAETATQHSSSKTRKQHAGSRRTKSALVSA